MSEVGQAALPPHYLLLFRSAQRRDRRLNIPVTERRRRPPRHEQTVALLVTHLAMTTFVFIALVTMVWLASWTLHSLHSVYAFPSIFFRWLSRLEILLVYADVVTSGLVLLNAIWHYTVGAIRGDP